MREIPGCCPERSLFCSWETALFFVFRYFLMGIFIETLLLHVNSLYNLVEFIGFYLLNLITHIFSSFQSPEKSLFDLEADETN